jgi:hypothetical protein
MLVKFTVNDGASGNRAEQQARPNEFSMYLGLLNDFNSQAEGIARKAIQKYIALNPAVTAAQIACTGRVKDEWYPEFDPLYDCLIAASFTPENAHTEAGKFLGLLVWSEIMNSEGLWHFTEYPKKDADFEVTYYFSVPGHIHAKAKEAQAETARRHGDEKRAVDLDAAAQALRDKFRRTDGSGHFWLFGGWGRAANGTNDDTSELNDVWMFQPAATPIVTVTPSSASITTMQALSVTVKVRGDTGSPAPTGTAALTSGTFTSSAANLSGGNTTISIPAGSLSAGTKILSVSYTPDSTSTSIYNGASGIASVTVTKLTPVVAVNPPWSSITTAQPLSVSVAVSGGSGIPTPTGSVTLTSGSYTSTAATLGSGSATINVPAGALAAGTDILTVSYTPETSSSTIYNSASGLNSVTLSPASPVLTWATPTPIVYGTALSAVQLNASANVPGTFAHNPDAGVVLDAGPQTLSVTFTPTDTINYTAATTTVQLTVNKATLTVTASSPTVVYGSAVPTITASYSGLQNGDGLSAPALSVSGIGTPGNVAAGFIGWALSDNAANTSVAGNDPTLPAVLVGNNTSAVASTVDGIPAFHLTNGEYLSVAVPKMQAAALANLWTKHPRNPVLTNPQTAEVTYGQLVRNPAGGWYFFAPTGMGIYRWESSDLIS